MTSQYTDYEARLSSLRTQEERLLSMLEKSDDVDSLIALEERLADVRYETESIERNLRNLDRQIAYSTVSVGLQEVEIYTPTKPVQRTFGEKMHDALSEGWSSFVRSLQYFLIDLTYSLPGLILFVLIVAAVIFVLLCIRRRVKAKKAAKKPLRRRPSSRRSSRTRRIDGSHRESSEIKDRRRASMPSAVFLPQPSQRENCKIFSSSCARLQAFSPSCSSVQAYSPALAA